MASLQKKPFGISIFKSVDCFRVMNVVITSFPFALENCSIVPCYFNIRMHLTVASGGASTEPWGPAGPQSIIVQMKLSLKKTSAHGVRISPCPTLSSRDVKSAREQKHTHERAAEGSAQYRWEDLMGLRNTVCL